MKLRSEALKLLRQIIQDITSDGDQSKQAAWIQRQAEIRVLQNLLASKCIDEVLAESSPLLEKCSGTVDELIVRSLAFQAFKQKHDTVKALETRDRMKKLFDDLPATAFIASSTEYSRDYWVKTWFTP